MGFWEDLTWRCHVCGDERPDACISVYKTKWVTSTGWQIEQNVRYCNDRPGCAAKAPDVKFVGEDFFPVDGIGVTDEAARPGEIGPVAAAERSTTVD